jgi:IMP cyclohydrolase
MYTSRIVGLGLHSDLPFVFFTLASRSIPFRKLDITEEKKGAVKVNVFAIPGYEQSEGNENVEVDNYACLKGGTISDNKMAAVSFNGHMCKRVFANLKNGVPPNYAMDMALLDFKGMPRDARIGAAIVQGKNLDAVIGIDDVDSGDHRIKKMALRNNLAFFVYDKNTSIASEHNIRTSIQNPSEFAEYLHHNIIGREIEFGAGTGVIIFNPRGDLSVGVYNHATPEKIAEWRLKH